MSRLRQWLQYKWQMVMDPKLVQSYQSTFSTVDGRRVLQHLFDSIYCTVYEGIDPNAALVHNARRSVVQEIIRNIDGAEHPEKYYTPATREMEIIDAPR